ncbi:MAG TPA: dehydrogenase E1 component subunit alpha/beta [Puia sp.]|jgi:2-oxoisovalerate dehydrogenase E1 component|nr:dehydrogenase E1 component subunit alpha/beta [Puia sp.]
MFFDRKDFSNQILLDLYRTILFPRLIEEKMLVLLRQGRISKWFSGIGQEAISAGVVSALAPDEWIMPLHRNLGIFTGRKMPLQKLFLQWQGSQEGFTRGRERSFHFGSREHYICGMISHLGPQLALADGAALGYKLKKQQKLAAAFTGEGGTSEGDFHEALNLAAVWDLPVIFIIENNGYGLSTPVKEQFRANRLADKGIGYGMESVQIDGNNILDVYDTIKGVREYCIREQKPYLVECMTFRMRGHEEASGTKYIPAELFEAWSKKDPVSNYENWLVETGILYEEKINEIRNEFRSVIENAISVKENPIIPDMENEINDMYAETPEFNEPEIRQLPDLETAPVKRFIDGIRDGLWQSMEKHENLVLMGQDIAAYGGAFKITEGFLEKFGNERIRNTPLCESAVVGAALGLSLEGFKSVMEMQFADFAAVGFNQIVNNLAKIHYRWGQPADVVIRMPTGAGVGAGPFHSQSNEAWFTHVPGLKVVYPSTPADAKGLLNAAILDPNPVLFFEHKVLYRSISGPLPERYYYIEIGKANLVSIGEEITIITYGAGVHWALTLADHKPEISFHILDLRTLLPLDYEAIREAVAKTGKVIILHEDTLTGGIGGEISAWIGQHCFELLDAPVLRCASLDTAIPFNIELEKKFLANARLWQTVEQLLSY